MPFTVMEVASMSKPVTAALVKALAISEILGADVLSKTQSIVVMMDPLLNDTTAKDLKEELNSLWKTGVSWSTIIAARFM